MPVNTAGIGLTGTDQEALFLKMYSGSFVTSPRSSVLLFDGTGSNIADNYIFRPNTGMGGKSFQFLTLADVPEGEDYDPGDDLLGQAMGIAEGELVTDKYVVCHHWIGKDKMDQAHYASQILPQLARAHKSRIERLYDRRAMITVAKSARNTAAVTHNPTSLLVHSGGNRVTRTGGSVATAYPHSSAGAANLRADLRTLGLSLTQDNIAPGPQNRGLVLDPWLKTCLTYDNTGQLFSKDYVVGNDQQRHEIVVVEGFALLGEANTTSNLGPLPNQNITDGPTKYQGNFTAQAADGIPCALALCRGMDGAYGVGSPIFEKMTHMVKYFPEKLSWLVMSYIRSGCDEMHRWCNASVEVIS